MVIETIFTDNLIEILLSIILLFNVGAYSTLWDRMEDIKSRTDDNEKLVRQEKANIETELGRIRKDVDELDERQKVFSKSIYGSRQDKTDDGHILETEEKIDSICETIHENEEQRKKDYKRLMKSLTHLADKELDQRIDDVDDILDAD